MKNDVECRLGEKDLKFLESEDRKARELLIEASFESLSNEDIQTLLADFCAEERETFDGNAVVENVDFESLTSGLISVNFTGSSYFGCRDMNRTFDYTEEVIFQIHRDHLRIVFSTETPDPMDRSPHEEF